MEKGKKSPQRNIEISNDTWAKVGVMAATTNKPKKQVVADAIEVYFASFEKSQGFRLTKK